MTCPPSISIVLELEGSLRVRVDAANDSEEARLVEWVCSHDDFRALVGRALELAGEAKAT